MKNLLCRLFGCVYSHWDKVMFCKRCGEIAPDSWGSIPPPPKKKPHLLKRNPK